MPVGEPAQGHGLHDLVRRVEVVRGSMPMRAFCRPAFDFARAGHRVEVYDDGALASCADGRPHPRHFRSRSVSIRAESAAGCCRRLG
jgi:hypothetical protein